MRRLSPPLPPANYPAMYMRFLPAGFVPPCLPTKAQEPPSGEAWLHEIKHDGFRTSSTAKLLIHFERMSEDGPFKGVAEHVFRR